MGSVGTRAWIILLRGPDGDPLFLQAKEAQPSVLAGYLDGPAFTNQGERVVTGQPLMQAAGDILLGWQQGPDTDGVVRDFYICQLRDGKGSAVIEAMNPDTTALYGRLCARALAYAHARAGDRFAIAGYLDSDDDFDKALTAFAETYADQNEPRRATEGDRRRPDHRAPGSMMSSDNRSAPDLYSTPGAVRHGRAFAFARAPARPTQPAVSSGSAVRDPDPVFAAAGR